jgi:hypothetical protein
LPSKHFLVEIDRPIGDVGRNSKMIDSWHALSYCCRKLSCNRGQPPISSLPPELRRRFTLGTFFFDLPCVEERQAI